jgi:hypothetical protein
MTPEEIRELELWIIKAIGYRFGTVDRCAPNYPDKYLGEVWWYEGVPYAPDELPRWTTEESASAMLLEMMSEANAYVWLEWDINEWCVTWLATTSEDQEPPFEYNNRDRKLAIALAFKAWKQSELAKEQR